MDKNNLLNLIDDFQEIVSYILPVFIVLFFLPVTSEFFEFNKMAFVLVASSLTLILWAVKAVKMQRLTLVKSPLDLGIGLLILSSILSTIFSVNKFSALFGQYGKFFPNIFVSIMLFTLYYTLTANITTARVIKNTVRSLLAATSIASLIGLLSYFNLTERIFPFEWVTGGRFNTMGSPITLGIVSAVSLGIAVSLIIETALADTALAKNRGGLILYFLSALLTGLYIISANNVPTWAAASVSVAFVALNLYLHHSEEITKSLYIKAALLTLVTLFAAFAVINYIPSVRKSLNINYTRIVEITLDQKTSWQISTSTLRDYPLFGSGISTYIMDFTTYKPLAFNATPFWNLRFYRPSNEFLRTFSEQGLLGLCALIILTLAVIKLVTKAKSLKGNLEIAGISSAVLGLFASLFFYSANTAIATIAIILLALLVSAQKELSEETVEDITLSASAIREKLSLNFGSSKKEVITYMFLGVSLLITVPTLFVVAKGYIAEIYRKTALTEAAKGNVGAAYNAYNKVILHNPFYDAYRRDSANIDLALVALIVQKGDQITEQDKADMQQLVNQAIRETRLTTEKINPLSVVNWEHKAWVLNQLAALDKNATQAAMDAAQRALQLDPLNPILRVGSGNVVGVGSIYYAAGDYQKAAISFAEAAQLKPDFANAYYNLSLSQAQLKNWEASATNMEIVLRLLPKDSEDFKIASDNLKVLKEQAEKAREELSNQQQQQQTQTPPAVTETPVTEKPTQTEPPVQQ